MQYNWLGNVRELKSALEYAFLVCDSRLIETHHLPPQFQSIKNLGIDAQSATIELSTVCDINEKLELIDALRQTGGNQTQASKILGVHRMTVWNRMRKYGISLKGGILS
jgi:transcriptional regulator of acetoin/glycerol metabolism